MIRRTASVIAVGLLAIGLTGCGGETTTRVAEKSGVGETRTDLEPLTKRFPLLAATESATWMSGTMGPRDSPGPSTYWIDAIATLPAAEHEALAELGVLSAGSLPDDFRSELTESVPTGELRTSPELNEAFSHDEFWSEVLLVDDGATLVLSSTFE